MHDYGIGIRTFFFVWILNVSVYLIHCCWHEFQDFCGNKHHVDASCVDDVIKTRKFLFIWMLIASVYLINFCWPEFLCFFGTNHVIYKPTIMRMLIVYWCLQNRDSSLCLNIDCLCSFHKLPQTWNSNIWWKQYHMSLQWGWCLLRNDIIKIGKFIFVWPLIVSI